MVTVSGILKTPAGAVLANTEIKFYAVATASNVLQGTTGIITTGSDGSYSVTLQQGSHRVTVRQGNTRPETIGLVHISADTTASTLNELLLAASAASPGNPLADEVLAARDRAETAASAAETSRAATQQLKADTAAIRDQTSQISGLDTVEQAIALASPDMLAKAFPGQYPFKGKMPSLAMDFARNRHHVVGSYGLEAKTITEILAVTSSAGNRVDHRGILVPVAGNLPVIDHDPATRQYLGLVVQEQRTNLAANSEALAAGINTTVDSNAAVAPDGAMTADFVRETTAEGEHISNDFNYVVTAGKTYVWSAFFKRPVGGSRRAYLRTTGGSLGASKTYAFDFSNPADTPDVGYIEYPNGWYRLWLRITPTGTGSVIFRTQIITGSNIYPGSTDEGMYIWGRQLEEGSFPGRYIPTAGAAVTRIYDMVSRAWENLSEFVLLLDFDKQGVGVDAGAADTFENCFYWTAGTFSLRKSAQLVLSMTTNVAAGRNRVAVRMKAGDYAHFRNGLKTASSVAAEAPPTNLVRQVLGNIPWSSGGASNHAASNRFYQYAIYPGYFSDADLQELTAL